jgi:hypothetical protein
VLGKNSNQEAVGVGVEQHKISEFREAANKLRENGHSAIAAQMDELASEVARLSKERSHKAIRQGMRGELLPQGVDAADLVIERSLQQSYDGRMAHDNASLAATGILEDLVGRRGIRDQLKQVDGNIRFEITDSIAAVIRNAALRNTFRLELRSVRQPELRLEDLYRDALLNLTRNVEAHGVALENYGPGHGDTSAARESLEQSQRDAVAILNTPLLPVLDGK